MVSGCGALLWCSSKRTRRQAKNATQVEAVACSLRRDGPKGCLYGRIGRAYANKNSFVRNSLMVSRSLAAFSNSKRFADSRISFSSFAI